MKKISLGQCNLDMEYKGEIVRFRGEIGLGCFFAWVNSTEWLPPDPDAPMTVNEKLEIMSAAHKYVWDEYCRTDFLDDETKAIFFDSHGNPLVYIDGENIKSSKANISCICEAFEEIDGFSASEFELWQMDITRLAKNKVLRKVHVWKNMGNSKKSGINAKSAKAFGVWYIRISHLRGCGKKLIKQSFIISDKERLIFKC